MQKKLNKFLKKKIETQENPRFVSEFASSLASHRFSGPQKSERFLWEFEDAKFIEGLTFEQLKKISIKKNDHYIN